MTALDLINKHLAAAKNHASVITYTDGSVQRIEHNNEQSAHNALRSYIPLIGKHEYISRATGAKIKIVSCEVVAL